MAASTIGTVEPFDPSTQDWEQYSERLEQYFIANNIDGNARKTAVFLTVVGPRGYGLLSNLVAPDKPSSKGYNDLVSIMKNHLKPKRLVIAERFRFHLRNQGDGESISTYMAELRKLAETCDFRDYLEEALRDRLVCGLQSEGIQKRLLAEENLSLQKAYETALSMEAATQRAGELQATKKASSAVASSATAAETLHYINRRSRPQAKPSKPPSQPRELLASTQAANRASACYRCGKSNHQPDDCYYRRAKCRSCGRYGHIAKVCQGQNRNVNVIEQDTSPTTDEELPLFNIYATQPSDNQRGITVNVEIDGHPLTMELDTRASVSLISRKSYEKVLGAPEIKPPGICLKTYTGEKLKLLGECTVNVKYEDKQWLLPLLIVDGDGPSLLGRNWLHHIQLNWGSIKKLLTPAEQILQEYNDVFSKELGTVKGVQAHLEVRPTAVPRFHKPRPVPYAIRGRIEEDLERLENQGIISKVNYSDWAAPIVPVPKADGGIRICGDYKVTINPVLEIDQFPVPTPEDLFATLAGGQTFTKLDLSQAYQQVLLDPESRRYVTITTHKGLYQYNRLPFGVASAPSIFQQLMENFLHGIPRLAINIDDLLITGKDDQEHIRILKMVLDKLREYGVHLKGSKCKIMKPSVDYLGYRIDKDGLHPLPEKVNAIMEAPKPTNVKELRAFLGLINYYGRFIPNVSIVTHPFNTLLKKGVPWLWSDECDKVFQELKMRLTSAKILAHYDPKLPLKLDCDASAYGVGAVLSHTYSDGTERPIAYASRTLTTSEKNYAQIEKEALALIFGIKKFHKYLYGRHFTLVTDHKPLTSILGSKQGLPTLAAARLQRWAVFLLGYQYSLEFRSTSQHCNADCFSRLPRPQQAADTCALDEGTIAFNQHQVNNLPLTAKRLRDSTIHDPDLSAVQRYTRDGWPQDVPDALLPYFRRKDQISIDCDCLFWGTRVIIPKSCQALVLEELHESHPGIVRMKGLARAKVWWPMIEGNIEKHVKNCDACQVNRNLPAHAPLNSWPWPKEPWERIHIDFAGPIEGMMYFIIVDSHSKWLEVVPMKSTTTVNTVDVLRSIFARYGIPKQLVSDNGPQFTSLEFCEFMSENCIKHYRTAPYHPSTNGAAERFVQTFKHALRVGKNDMGTLNQKLARFLMQYRNTPHTTTGVSPAELFMKRQLRTRLDLMKPSYEDKVMKKQLQQKQYHDKNTRQRDFEVGTEVLARNFRSGHKWSQGTIIKRNGPVTYDVSVAGEIWKRHVDQLLLYEGSRYSDIQDSTTEEFGSNQDLLGLDTPQTTLVPIAQDPVIGPEDSTDRIEEPEASHSRVDEVPAVTEMTAARKYPSRSHQPPKRFNPTDPSTF